MTMKERLQMHKRIEAEDKENREAAAFWDGLSETEILDMIEERDREMKWDDQFGFLVQLLDRKQHHAELGI